MQPYRGFFMQFSYPASFSGKLYSWNTQIVVTTFVTTSPYKRKDSYQIDLTIRVVVRSEACLFFQLVYYVVGYLKHIGLYLLPNQ